MWFKDDPALAAVNLAPSAPIPVSGGALARSLAQTYNRLGGLMTAIAAKAGVRVEAALAVWQVESGGLPHLPGRPVLRFENHRFYREWGTANPATFDAHFQFGGRAGVPGQPWKNHKWRRTTSDSWKPFHGDQDDEYQVFEFARALGSAEAAARSASFGGPQILGSNHDDVGYPSAAALFEAMAQSERWEVCAFFDFCLKNKLIDEIRDEEWFAFATGYNGSGNAAEYGPKIADAYEVAIDLPIAGAPMAVIAAAAVPAAALPVGADDAYMAEFIAMVSALNLRYFKPYELLALGHQHADPASPAFGLNHVPPRGLWPNIAQTIDVLDDLRDILAAPIVISSAYRSPAYNAAIAGAGGSQHMQFNALDFSVRSPSSPADWAGALKDMRASGRFKGGIGVYSTFVHLDTRGYNANW